MPYHTWRNCQEHDDCMEAQDHAAEMAEMDREDLGSYGPRGGEDFYGTIGGGRA